MLYAYLRQFALSLPITRASNSTYQIHEMPFHTHNYPSLKYEHDKPRITLISLRIAKYLTFSKPVNIPLLLLDTYTQKHFRFISCQTFQQINIFIFAKPKSFYYTKGKNYTHALVEQKELWSHGIKNKERYTFVQKFAPLFTLLKELISKHRNHELKVCLCT